MSDGLTDARNATLAAERRRQLVVAVAECLESKDRTERYRAVNSLMEFQERLFDVPPGTSREAAAMEFLDRLHDSFRDAWAQILAFALRDCGDRLPAAEFARLKQLSPFRGKTLVVSLTGYHGTRLTSIRDLERLVGETSAGSDNDGFRLLALDCSVDISKPVRS